MPDASELQRWTTCVDDAMQDGTIATRPAAMAIDLGTTIQEQTETPGC